ncbi:ATP-binding protein [Lactobacillus huangpiensis]|uniref:ATP-binding protein n=1 Tax=Lactobacillus huangpiensis TaxID=2799571 RepID=UPI001CC7DE60|nr:ATP-binding protein [Lactobacillus huangpiensis]
MKINGKAVNIIAHRTRTTDQICPKHHEHLVYLDGFKKMKPFCEQCQYEKNQAEIKKMAQNLKINQTRGYLKRQSLVDRDEVFNYTFKNFKAQPKTFEYLAKSSAHDIAKDYLRNPDAKGNCIFYGNAGSGKTHLAMAILNAVNDNSDPMGRCLFISVNKLIREMKNWFTDKTGIWSPKHVTDVVSKANLVVLDDLGAESANNMATSFVQDTIFDIYESNQRIITTTNLSLDELYRTYHSRLVSRMQESDRRKVIDFSKIADKRPRI